MSSRKNKSEEPVDHHRWVISYADFITLLFAFFVVMYSISSVNVSKYKSVSDGMKSAFNKKDQNKALKSTAQLKDGPQERDTKGKYQDGLDELNKSLSEIAGGDYTIHRHDGWIELEIKAGSLFDPGDVALKPEAVVKLMQIANKIKSNNFPVVVEGYTDNLPIETPQFPSNWELSATRAASVGRILNGYGIPTSRILVTGYGEQYPIADNFTEVGRGENRRVNIIIAKNRKINRLLNPSLSQNHAAVIHEVLPAAPTKTDADKKEKK